MKKTGNEKGSGTTELIKVFSSLESGLRRYLMRFFIREQDIEDAVQETFLRTYESGMHQDIRSPKSFIYKVAKNLALSEISKKTNQLLDYVGDIDELGVIDNRKSIIENLIEQEKLTAVCEAMYSLPPQCQRVMVMRKVLGFSHKEIAFRLEISTKTVENHLTKGLQRCQDTISKNETIHPEYDVVQDKISNQ